MFLRKYPLTIIWCVFILVLCSVHINDIPGSDKIHIPNFDKFVHFMFFFILSFLIYYETNRQQNHNLSRIKFSLLILCIAAFYGGFIELLQKYVFPYRSAEWLDFAADTAGALVAIFLAPILFRKRARVERI